MTTDRPALERSRTLDVLRGLTILAMVFVNDLAGVADVPAWMKHNAPHDADGMTFVDVVFPAFLFIVGLSIPLSLGKRLARGDGRRLLLRHVAARTASLLLIGAFMVNGEHSADSGPVSPASWSLILYAGVFLVFGKAGGPNAEAGGGAFGRARLRRAAGIALLVAAGLLYRGRDASGLVQLRPHWWGILGLIGWAYLVAASLFLALRGDRTGLVGAIPLLFCVYVAHAVGAFSGWWWLDGWMQLGPMLGSHAAIVVSGVALGLAVGPGSSLVAPVARVRWALGFALALAACAALLHTARDLHPMFIVNKILATPPWCLWSSAITAVLWVALYWTIDVRGWARWAVLLEHAGQNALTAYLLAFVADAFLDLVSQWTGIPNLYAAVGGHFAAGLARSILFSLLIVWLAGRLRQTSLQLSL